jgi:hypothetical protein
MHLVLARTLGYPSRRALYADMTALELAEWEALYSIDPWGEERGDLRNGILCSLTDACHRTKGQPDAPIDYMPYVKELQGGKQEQTPEQMKAIFRSAVAAFGGKWKDGKGK